MSLFINKIKQILVETRSKALKRSLAKRMQTFTEPSGQTEKHTVVQGSKGSHEERRKRREKTNPTISNPKSTVEVD